MSWRMPDAIAGREQDCSYSRILRRLDQALDVALTRQWLAGSDTGSLYELELRGLSQEDMQVLRKILASIDASAMLPVVVPPAVQSGRQEH